MVSGQHYGSSNMVQGTSMAENQSASYLKKMSNYTKSQARYLWFYILPDISGSRIYKQGI